MKKNITVTPDTPLSSVELQNIHYDDLIRDYGLIGVNGGNILTTRTNSIRIQRKRTLFGWKKVANIQMTILNCDEVTCKMLNDLITRGCVYQMAPVTEV